VRVFEGNQDTPTESSRNKVNIVDENNVFVGYDFEHSCCENFGYYFTKKLPTTKDDPLKEDQKSCNFRHEEYQFDTKFFLELNGEKYDEGGAVVFLLKNKWGSKVYLVLYNCHNGYYSHGFEMFVGDKKLRDGDI